MNRKRVVGLALVALVGLGAAVALRGGGSVRNPTEAGRKAAIYPDYSDTVVPPNIAPINLKVLESGSRFCVRLSAAAGQAIEIYSGDGNIGIRPDVWRALLGSNRGAELRMDIYAKGDTGWVHFETVRNRIAAEPVDPYVAYRYIPPIYNRWYEISIRQRDLRSFEEREILNNHRNPSLKDGSTDGFCMNCHTFLNHGTDRMLIHIRPGQKSQIPAMLLVRNGRAEKVDTRTGNAPATYTTWHPKGKLLAFSRNSIMQMFHTAGVETREVVDRDSDLSLYNVETGEAWSVPQISRPDRMETFPAWSPDGRYLYFSSAPRVAPDKNNTPLQYDRIQYDLVRISYDDATGRWGELETVVAASHLGKSISLAQVSPDGRLVMFCGHAYGSFPIFQPSSDLYVVDVGRPGAEPRRLDEINSPQTDSYHTWSSNGRWVVFTSKREDGFFGRLYLTYLDAEGRFSKPMLVPQRDPEFYGRCLMTYNRPEFLTQPVKVSTAELTRALAAPPRQAKGGSSPGTTSPDHADPWQR